MIESFTIISAIVVSALLFGAVESWSFALGGGAVVVAFNLWLYRSGLDFRMPEVRWQKLMVVSIAGFLGICLLQIIPFPAFLIKFLSPSTYSLLRGMTDRTFLSVSVYPHETLNGIVKAAVYIMIFLMAASLQDRGALRRIMVGLVVFGFFLSVFAIIQNATWNGKIYWFRELTMGGAPFGPFVNRNHFAGFVGMIIPLGMGLVLEKRHKEKSLLLFFLTLIIAVGLFYSLSRGGIFSFLASTALFSALTLMRGIGRKSVFYVSVFSLAVALYLLYLGISPIIERFTVGGISENARWLAWNGTLRAFMDFPLMGTGLGSFRYVFPVYYPKDLTHEYHYAHNDYLQLLLETGVAGFLFAALFFISVAAVVVEYGRRKSVSPMLAGLSASVLYMLVHSVYDFNLHIPSNAMVFSAILGLVVAYVKGTRVTA